MRNKVLISLLLFISCFSCNTDDETNKLDTFLKSFKVDIKNYKVICVVPADGCGSCINPSLVYAKQANKMFLLVLSSMYKKSISHTINKAQLKHTGFISDFHNKAIKSGLATEMAPCFYFVKDGKVVRKFDSSTTFDKKRILEEVDKYLTE